MLQEEHDVYIPYIPYTPQLPYTSSASVDVANDEPGMSTPPEDHAFQPPHYPTDPHVSSSQPHRPNGRAGAILLLTLVLAIIFGVGLLAGWEFTSSNRSSTATTAKSVSTTSITTSGSTAIETQQEAAIAKIEPAVVELQV